MRRFKLDKKSVFFGILAIGISICIILAVMVQTKAPSEGRQYYYTSDQISNELRQGFSLTCLGEELPVFLSICIY